MHHFLYSFQEVHKWLQTSPVSEKEHADVRRVLIHFISELKGTETEEEFIFTVSEMEQRIEFAAFTSMLQADWLPCAEKWCDFSRNCFYDMEANSLIERFFLKIHHQFLKGLHTRKSLEELLRLIADNVMEHRNFIDGMVNMSILMEGTASEQAGVLLHQGWSQLVTWQGHWMAHVPCHNIPETVYRVNLVTMELKENTSKKPVDPSKKKLRAVVRTVKRQRNTDDHEDDQILAVIPSLKVSRSGRHIKIKEEPDFVT
ncbi:hypothetical protein C7M84_009463 [Penaeus vannamei]|uniref:Uncharacterized protein n=1 Tax=Penaeus vannamei TaxID=6689 RepID=A0A3R7SRR8_PENVA|nr:hypothetical protein C7M84_009463 [Penaeus vannamei]